MVEDESKHLGINSDGQIVDWLVQMRRFPAAERLDNCIKAGGVECRRLAEVLRLLIAAYQSAKNAGITAVNYQQKLEVAILRNASTLDILDQHDVIEQQLEFLKDRAGAIGARAGYALDAHGDLRPEHIYLLDPPVIVDRLEFNQDLRLLDPVDELAFLAIECERVPIAASTRASRTPRAWICLVTIRWRCKVRSLMVVTPVRLVVASSLSCPRTGANDVECPVSGTCSLLP